MNWVLGDRFVVYWVVIPWGSGVPTMFLGTSFLFAERRGMRTSSNVNIIMPNYMDLETPSPREES